MNITTVAKQAGVSNATVSRVMNKTGRVSLNTRKRVQEVIESLNFYPDANAQTLVSGRSDLYGLIISDLTNPFLPELVKAFEEIAAEHSKETLISNANYEPERMETCIIRMLQRKVDGIAILAGEVEERLVRTLSQRRVPTVYINTVVMGATSVSLDYAAGIEAAMDHLFALGHQHIAFIGGPITLTSARLCANAYQAVLRRKGIGVRTEWMQESDQTVEGGRNAMKRILTSGSLPTAVLGWNDRAAIGSMEAIRENWLKVPRDISVIGFDDIEMSAYISPALTTLSIPWRELASTAFRALGRCFDEGVEETGWREHLVLPKLVTRESTGVVTHAPSKRSWIRQSL